MPSARLRRAAKSTMVVRALSIISLPLSILIDGLEILRFTGLRVFRAPPG
jgi:hypothetical protein